MTTVGKILTVMIFIMSIMFMVMTFTVFATHKNWRDAVLREQAAGPLPAGLKKQLTDERTQAQELAKQIRELKDRVKLEEIDKKNQVAKLTTNLDAEKLEVETLEKRLAKIEDERKTAVAAVEASQEQLNNLFAEVKKIRGDIRTSQEDRDKQYQQVVELLDQVNSAKASLALATERRNQIDKQLSSVKRKAEAHGINLEAPDVPPLVMGKVLKVNAAEKLLEISLGSDDGIAIGSKLEVFRGSRYLAQVEVLTVNPDRAVARIVPHMLKAPIQRDDNVTTRFKNDVALGSN